MWFASPKKQPDESLINPSFHSNLGDLQCSPKTKTIPIVGGFIPSEKYTVKIISPQFCEMNMSKHIFKNRHLYSHRNSMKLIHYIGNFLPASHLEGSFPKAIKAINSWSLRVPLPDFRGVSKTLMLVQKTQRQLGRDPVRIQQTVDHFLIKYVNPWTHGQPGVVLWNRCGKSVPTWCAFFNRNWSGNLQKKSKLEDWPLIKCDKVNIPTNQNIKSRTKTESLGFGMCFTLGRLVLVVHPAPKKMVQKRIKKNLAAHVEYRL